MLERKILSEVSETTVKTTTYHMDTDNIEYVIRKYLKLPDEAEVDFRWDISQWVSLTITSKSTVKK